MEIVEPRRAGRGGGDVRSGGDAEAAGAANPLRRPGDNPGEMERCLPRSRFVFVCVV